MPYNNIPDGEIDPDSPVTASLMQKLRDNPIGIAQAADGAPPISLNALDGRISTVASANTLENGNTVSASVTVSFSSRRNDTCNVLVIVNGSSPDDRLRIFENEVQIYDSNGFSGHCYHIMQQNKPVGTYTYRAQINQTVGSADKVVSISAIVLAA